MRKKSALRNIALKLRNQGLSYSEISDKLPVSKSSLSLWLREIKLKENQKQRLFKKMVAAQPLGSAALKQKRLNRTKMIIKKALSEIPELRIRDLSLIGTTLYWAEGHKQKEHNPSQGVWFSNSDPKMVLVFLKWLKLCLKVPEKDIWFEIYIHTTYRKTEEQLKAYWSKITSFPKHKFNKIYFKKNKVYSYRKNRGEDYSGVLRICIKRSTDLNRQIGGWAQGIVNRLEAIQ